MTVKPGAVISCSGGHPLAGPIEIPSAPNLDPSVHGGWETSESMEGAIMEDGWTHTFSASFKSDDVYNCIIALTVVNSLLNYSSWLGQANTIFHDLQITSNFEVYGTTLILRFVPYFADRFNQFSPIVFLFLCPQKDFRTGSSSFRWPDCPAYWSLDPSGVDQLTFEETIHVGFPAFQLTTTLGTCFMNYHLKASLLLPMATNKGDADSDAEANLEEDNNNSGSADYSSYHAPRNSNSVNHDHHGM
ncbi:hypothetical protein B0H14DRAFT_2630487 [Mycena olivaceomarginata]|nr:hypothetical protein B0H14DRAFT_2630487 [Mycena olivaceomarginata]